MSETIEEELKQPIFEEEPVVVDKKQERRERLLKQLEKGRKTALANRKKKALHKKLTKKEQEDTIDTEIKEKLLAKQSVEDLRRELDELKASKAAPQPKVPEPQPEVPEPKPELPEPKPEPPKPMPPKPMPPNPSDVAATVADALDAFPGPVPPSVFSTYTKPPW